MLRVLIAATASPPSPAHCETLRKAGADADTDWSELLRLVERHRVAPLVYARVADGALALPPHVAATLKAWAVRDRHAALQLTALLVRLTKALAAAGIAAVSLKGPALALIAYGEVTRRQARDLDLLVDPADLGTATRVLATAGCTLVSPHGDGSGVVPRGWARIMKDAEFVDRDSGATVELHWRLNNNPHLMPLAPVTYCTVTIGGETIRTFAPDDQLLYLAVHGARHAWTRLKWLTDVHALTAPLDGEALAAFHAFAQARGLATPVSAMLLLLETTYGLALPPTLRAEIVRSRRARAIVALSLQHLVLPIDTARPPLRTRLAAAREVLLMHAGRSYRTIEVLRHLIDLTTFQSRGGTPRALALAVAGRPALWLMRTLRRG